MPPEKGPVKDQGGAARPRGFGHSKKRVWTEILLFIAAGIGLLVVVLWLARAAAESLAEAAPPSLDRALGEQASLSLGATLRDCGDPEALAYVQTIAELLLAEIQTPFEFQFRVVKDETVNAFALPGGFITVNSGLLEKAKRGEEVAGVLAHELCHVTERHGTERIVRQLGSFALLSLVFGGTNVELPVQIATNLVHTAYDRDQESEADRVGIEVLKRAGIDPTGMADFFERLEGEALAVPPELLSTHPDPGNRAIRAREAARDFKATRTLEKSPPVNCR